MRVHTPPCRWRPRRRALVAALLAAIAGTAGCTDDRVLSGQWQTSERVVDPLGILLNPCEGRGPGCLPGAFVQFNLGHYGRDVVGTLRFLGGTDLVPDPAVALRQCGATNGCDCQRITGVYDAEGKRFEFFLPTCADPVTDPSRTRQLVTLRLLDNDTLEWEVNGQAIRVLRAKEEKSLTVEDKACTCERSSASPPQDAIAPSDALTDPDAADAGN